MITGRVIVPTAFGVFLLSYHTYDTGTCISLLIDQDTSKIPLVRIHSSCLFGESFGASGCDCQQQLHGAMKAVSDHQYGAIIYTYNEGRGLGLENKIRAMAIEEEKGVTTAAAYDLLGFPRDARSYDAEIEAMKELGLNEITLLTANPRKIAAVRGGGITVSNVMPVICSLNSLSLNYVLSKQRELNHIPIYASDQANDTDPANGRSSITTD